MRLFKKNKNSVWLIVFLGNPGKDYENTRHNVGFMAADAISDRKRVKINKVKFKGLYCRAEIGGEDAVLLKPLTYMNLSGEAALAAADYFKIPPERIVVIYDDVSLPVGKLRIRKSGSAGGHKGVASMIKCLGTDVFPRIKIGVGAPPHPDYAMPDWVLGKFANKDRAEIDKVIERALDALEELVENGPDSAMNWYN